MFACQTDDAKFNIECTFILYVGAFTCGVQSGRFLRRKPTALFPLLTNFCMCLFHDISSVKVTPRYMLASINFHEQTHVKLS